MSDEKDGLYDKYRVIKTDDLDQLAKLAEQSGQIGKYAAETVKWVEMVSISGMNDQGIDGSQFVFVLRPDKDYHALVALNCYAASVAGYNKELSEDIFQAIDLMEAPTNMVPD